MEILFEFLFQIILEGSIELGSEKTVPKPLRILAAFIVFTVFFGMGGVFVYTGYNAALANDRGAAIVLFVVGAFLLFGGMFAVLKIFLDSKSSSRQ